MTLNRTSYHKSGRQYTRPEKNETTFSAHRPQLQTDEAWLEDLRSFLQQKLSNPDLSIPQVAAHFAMSESTLLRRVKQLTDYTPIQYLQELRLERALQLLSDNDCPSIGKVAAATGYRDTRSFSRLFKRRFGVVPSEYVQHRTALRTQRPE